MESLWKEKLVVMHVEDFKNEKDTDFKDFWKVELKTWRYSNLMLQMIQKSISYNTMREEASYWERRTLSLKKISHLWRSMFQTN